MANVVWGLAKMGLLHEELFQAEAAKSGLINRATPSSLDGFCNGKSQPKMDDDWGYPLVNIQKTMVNKQFAIENGHLVC